MKLRDDDTLDPRVERELEAIEAALRGEAVDHDLADLAELSADLSGLRASPEEPFAARLDARAAAGFKSGDGRERAGRLGDMWKRFRSASLSRQLMPIGATALAAIVIATAVVAVRPHGSDDSAQVSAGAGGSADSSAVATSGGAAANGPATSSATTTSEAAPSEIAPLPSLAPGPPVGTPGSRARTDRGSSYVRAQAQATVGHLGKQATGPFASDQNHRAIERDAQLTLGTDPEKVQDVSDDVLGVVGRYEGIVLNSSVSDGPAGEAGAQFELLIPSDRLGDALADLSGAAEVRSREETTKDITAPTVTTQEHLRDARAEVEGLLKQLANADTDEERRSADGQLAFQRQRIAGLRATLSSLERRANLSHVSLDIVTGDAASFGDTGNGRWTIRDALADAGHILGTAAAVTLVGLAILAPLALLALIIWLARRGFVGQSRRRALEG